LLSTLNFTAFVGLLLAVPSQREYLKAAKVVLGAKPGRAKGFWNDIKKSCKVMRAYWLDHVFFVFALIPFGVQTIVYPSLVGEYIELLWGSEQMGDDFSGLLTILTATLGTAVALVISLVADSIGKSGFYLTSFILLALLSIATVNILGPTSFQQYTCLLSNVCIMGLATTVTMKYCVAYSPPSLLGTFNGVIWLLVIVGFTFELTWFFGFVESATTASQLGVDLMSVNLVAVVCVGLWSVRQFIKGLPNKPPLLHEENQKAGSNLEESFL